MKPCDQASRVNGPEPDGLICSLIVSPIFIDSGECTAGAWVEREQSLTARSSCDATREGE
jgi:hypothetical protein